MTWAVTVIADSSTDDHQSAPTATVTPTQITAAYPDVYGATGVGGGAFAPTQR